MVTSEDIDEVLSVLDVMMTRSDDIFTKAKIVLVSSSRRLPRLDSIEKQLEISEDERLVMAHQLTQLHDWVERATKRIDVKFAH